MDYTSTALLASIRRRGHIPAAAALGGQDADLLRLINEELRDRLVPELLKLRRELFVARKTQAITVGKAAYRIPSRAIGGKFRELKLVDSGGNEVDLVELDAESSHRYGAGLRGAVFGYMLEGDEVVLVRIPDSAAWSLFQKIFLRPAEVVAESAVRVVLSVTADSPTAGKTRVALTVAAPGTFTAASLYDIVPAKPGFKPLGWDIAADAVAGANVDFLTASLPTGFSTALNAGDYICLADQSPVAQVPLEAHSVLVLRVVTAWLSDRDPQAFGQKMTELALAEEQMRSALSPGNEGEAKIVGAAEFSVLNPYGDSWIDVEG